MQQPVIPPRTLSSGAPVHPSKLEQFKRPARPSVSPPSRSPAPEPMMDAPALNRDEDEDAPLPTLAGIRAYFPPHVMQRIGDCTDDEKFLSSAIREWGAKLWPEGSNRPDKMWTREGMFSDKERTVKDRKLSNMVLGILGRITPENYEAMKAELIALPIRQSTDEEITDVVKLMYNKAVRPEDALYTEIYAQLMADLVQHTGVQGVGKTIRKAIIDKCQHQFEQPFVLPDEDRVDAEGNPLPDEDIQMKSMQLKERLKCNIKFLGHLFLCGMVNEKVVNFVLFHLLYGKEDANRHAKRRPEEYEVEMFCDLLKKVGKTLSQKTQQDYLPGYMKSLENLRAKTSKRLMFMLLDLEEMWKNNWEPRSKAGQVAGPMKLADFEKRDTEMRAKEQADIERALQQQNRRGGHSTNTPTSPKTPAPRPEAAAPLPAKELINGVMEAYTADGTPSHIEEFFKPIPPKERLPYLAAWISRIVKVAKKEDDRKKLGGAIEVLISSGIMKPDDIEKAFIEIADKIVNEQLYEDMPKLFNWWFELVSGCKKNPSPTMHTQLLRRLIKGSEYPVPKDVIVQMVCAVIDSSDPNLAHRDPLKRFRPLPAILTYANPLPNPNISRDEVGEEEADTGDDDLLASVLARTVKDPELTLFSNLTSEAPPNEVTSYIQQAENRTEQTFAPKIMSAFFTYARCDTTGNVMTTFREPLTALFRSGVPSHLLVAEVYLTWRELGRLPAPSCLRFIEKLKEMDLVKPSDLAQAWSLVQRVESGCEPDFSQNTGYVREQRQPGSPASAAPLPRGGRGGR